MGLTIFSAIPGKKMAVRGRVFFGGGAGASVGSDAADGEKVAVDACLLGTCRFQVVGPATAQGALGTALWPQCQQVLLLLLLAEAARSL